MALQLYTARFSEGDIVVIGDTAIEIVPALGPTIDLHNRFGLSRGPGGSLFIVKSSVTVMEWDGTTLSTVAGTPVGSQCSSMSFDSASGRLYFGITGSALTAKVAYYDGASWTTLGITGLGGDQFTGLVAALADGTVLAYSQNQGAGNNHGQVLKYNGTSWDVDMDTLDDFGFPSSSRHSVQQLWTDGAEVYACFENDNNDALPNLLIFKRDAAGAWTNISPTTISRDFGFVTAVCLDSNGELYAGYNNEAGTVIEIWKRTAAGVWSIDFDVLADEPGTFWTDTSNIIEFDGYLMATPLEFATDYHLKKSGGSWAHYDMPPSGGFANGHAIAAAGVEAGMSVDDVVPGFGSIVGGNMVDVIGTGFQAGADVVIDNLFATDITVVSDTLITCRVPAHVVPAFVDVTVTNPDNSFATGIALYEYQQPIDPDTGLPEVIPEISWMGSGCAPGSVAPANGSMAGGTAVTIHGVGFRQGSSVYFGGTPATDVLVSPAGTSITCVTPPHQVGAVDVVVISP